ncbi:autotransporter outer membrane beta-barrel domain-containing protein [Bartonella sp. B10]
MIVKISRNHLHSCVFTAAMFSFLSNADVEAGSDSKSPILFSCKEDKLSYRCNDRKKHVISDKVYNIIEFLEEEKKGNGSFMLPAAIMAQESGTVIQAMRIQVKGTNDASNKDTNGVVKSGNGVFVSKGGKVVLYDSTFKDVPVGLKANGGEIEINRGIIGATKVGVYAENKGTSVILKGATIKVDAQETNKGTAIFSAIGADINMLYGAIDTTNAAALYVSTKGNATLDGIIVTAKNKKTRDEEDRISHAVLNINQYGSINLKNSSVVASNVRGLWIGLDANAPSNTGTEENILVSHVNIEDSKITVTGDNYGIHLDMKRGNNEYEQGIVVLKRTAFEVLDGTAIHSSKSSGYIAAFKGTTISGDLLLTSERGSSITLLVNSSSLTGGARISGNSTAELYLTEDSQWLLTKRKKRNLQDFDRVNSSVSFVKLSDSAIAFEDPTSHEYQVLRIGNGSGEVYNAQGNARLYLNTYINSDGSLDHQRTDRLLIHGDVSGRSTVHVQIIVGNQEKIVNGKNAQDISIIQVSGKAEEDSFQLSGGYIALDGLPYQYYLRAYGPSSSLGRSRTSQRLVEGNEDFWDFRLENKRAHPTLSTPDGLILSASDSSSHTESRTMAVVPQVPTYLLLPNSLFQVGLLDISNQNNQLTMIRTVSSKLLKINESPSLFLRGYSGNYRYSSNLSALEYGYGGNLDYSAIKADILLSTAEHTSFGVMGIYGKFSLSPQNVEKSQKSTLDRWLVTAYGSMKHDVGVYVDGLLSYGLFRGDILTSAKGKVATLKGSSFSSSLTIGKTFMTRYEGLVFDPQIQSIYQYLRFNKERDIDGLDIEIGNPDKWMMRVGGSLTKTFVRLDKNRTVSFYGNLHFAHSFEGKQFAHFKDPFQLGSFGSSLEIGFGVHSQLSPKITIQSDFIYKHKLTQAGFSGINFSGGLRYHF